MKKPKWDTESKAGWGPFNFGRTSEADDHDLGSLICDTEECHIENDENFLKNLWFKFKRKRTVAHIWELGQGYAVKALRYINPFWHRPYSRIKEWIAWEQWKRENKGGKGL